MLCQLVIIVDASAHDVRMTYDFTVTLTHSGKTLTKFCFRLTRHDETWHAGPQTATSLGGGRAMSDASDGTGDGLLAFLDWAGARGELPPATAKSMGVTVGKVLAVEPDPAAVDVRNVDPEDLFSRFETLNRTSYTTESMKTYRSRFSRAVSMYLAWLDKRPDWKSAGLRPPSKAVAVRASTNGKPSRARPKKPPAEQSRPAADVVEIAGPPSAVAMVPYDLPLRPGLRVRLVLPELLTQADARRIAAFVDSLAFDQAEATAEGDLNGRAP
jgi:hypothetical protein